LCAGSYSITIEDYNNCSISQNFIITEPDYLVVVTSATSESSIGANDGTATCISNGGTPPYFFKWTTGDTLQSIDSLSPGDYLVTVTDALGCSKSDTAHVFEAPAALLINTEQINVSCFGESNGYIKITSVENGVSPFTYSWDTGSTDAFLINIKSGHYIVTVTDSDGKILIKDFDITEPDEISIAEIIKQDIKTDTLGSISIVINNSENYTFLWSGPNNYSNTSMDINKLISAGCYTLLITNKQSACSIVDTICISKVLTNNFELLLNKVAIYPNPAFDILNIDFLSNPNSKAEIIIYDLTGKQEIKINKSDTNKILKINTQSLRFGVYILELLTQEGYFYQKLVIGK
jgi:hypothetical protein